MACSYKKLLALACVLVLLVCGLAACKSEPGAVTTAAPTEPAQDLPLEVYWNLDRALYDGMSEAGMSSRMPETDGYFHVRMFRDGQVFELKASDRRVINHLDTLDMMGFEFENGIIVDVIPVEEMPMEKVGWQFYVQSVGGNLVKVNSSNKMNGMEILLELNEGSKIYDMSGVEGEPGKEITPTVGDRVYPIVDLDGNVKTIFVYQRDNFVQEAPGECIHCKSAVTWKLWDKPDRLPTESGHYQLQNNIQLKGQVSLPEDCKMCLDLNGKIVDGQDGARVLSMHNAGDELAIMDTSAGQNGAIRAHGDQSGQGGVLYVRFGAFYLYSGTLDGSDAVNTYAGALMCINKGAYAYINGGTIKGGTAKYSLDANKNPSNGMGGNIRVLGKLVINDGLITGGKALAYSSTKNGKTSYARGYGGNIYMGTGGTLEMNGGKVANGVAGGMGGNIYIDGVCEMTMTGGIITGGRLSNPSANGGNLFVGSKASFNMSGGAIQYGQVYNGGGNIYANGKVVISGGSVFGGRVIDKATGKVKNAVHNNLYVVNGDLSVYGGVIEGGVTVTDSSATDNKQALMRISQNAYIYGAPEGCTNLNFSSSGSKVLLAVGKLSDRAKIGVSTTRGVFTQPRDAEELEHFVSDIPGAEVVYYEGAYALGKLGCLCGKETHADFCDGQQRLWSPWTGSGLPTSTGNYYLTGPVSMSTQSSLAENQKVVLDLNGQTVSGELARIYSVHYPNSSLTITDTVGGGVIKNISEKTDLGGIVLVRTDAELNLLAGTLDASASKCVNNNGGGAVFVNTGATFRMQGGIVKGAAACSGNGAAVAIAKNGYMSLTGGSIVGGKASAARGGSISVLGTLDMSGGSVTGGSAQYGGNIYVEGKLNLSGGSVTGGTGNTRNILVLNGEACISGGTVDGGVTIDDRTAGDGICATLRLSGAPKIIGAATNLNLLNRGDRPLVYVDGLQPGAQISVSGPAGVFTEPCDEANAQYFTCDSPEMDLFYMDGALAMGRMRCLCGQESHLPGCDGTKHLWSAWAKTNSTLPTTTGYWYLEDSMTLTGYAELGANQNVVLDLNGKTATTSGNRLYSVHNTGASLVITDTTTAGSGTLKVTGSSGNAGLGIYVRNGNATLIRGTLDASQATTTNSGMGGTAIWINKGRTFTMYGGTILGGIPTKSNNGGTIEVSSGGAMEMYGGTVVGSNAPDNAINGTAINISGSFKLCGGTVQGGTTKGVGGTICVKGTMELSGGTVTGGKTTGNGGNIYITDTGSLTMTGGTVEKGTAAYGHNIFVDGNMTMSGGTVQSGNVLVLDGTMTLTGGKVLGGLHVDDRSATDSVTTLLTISGTPEVAGMNLLNRGATRKLHVGNLTVATPIPISAPAGIFATVESGVDANKAAACFVSKDAAMRVSRQADGLHMVDSTAVIHCLCGQSAHTPGCDGIEYLWQKWAKTNTTLPTTTGYWYLTGDMTVTGESSVGADQKVVLDLNGKTVSRAGGRIYNVFNTGSSLVVTDSTAAGNGTAKVTGTSANSGLGIYVRSGDATWIRGVLDTTAATTTHASQGGVSVWINNGRTFTLYGGTILGGVPTKCNNGGTIEVSSGGAMEMYGGTVVGSNAPDNALNGAAINNTGSFKMYGGTVQGGTTKGVGGAICARGLTEIHGGTVIDGTSGNGRSIYANGSGDVKLMGGQVGDVYIAGKVSLSGAPQVKSLTVPADKLTVGALESGADITVIGTGVVAKNVETDVSAYFKAADAAQKVVYNAAEKTLTVQ